MWHRALMLLLLSAATTAQEVPAAAPATVKVAMQTALGPIELLIETERAPITAANFLRYVDERRFDGIVFYRALKIGDSGEFGLVQGGAHGDAKRILKPIAHESTTVTGLSHVSGAISMARYAPGTAASEFFIVLGNLPALDAQPNAPTADGDAKTDTEGYAVFGRVIDGMDVIRAILEQPRSATAGDATMKGQMLATPVKILSMRRVEEAPASSAP